MADCYAYTAEHPEIRAIVITGNDRYFYTGGRVDASVPGESQRYADAIERLTQLQDANKTPMIAAISGDCMKAGMGLAAKCDFAIAREGALFSFPEVRMGGAPMMVMAETIDALPRKKALEAYYSSWNYSAQEMLQAGFLNAVVPADQFDATVEKYLRILLDTPRALIELTRTAYDEMDRAPQSEGAPRHRAADAAGRCAFHHGTHRHFLQCITPPKSGRPPGRPLFFVGFLEVVAQ